VSDPVLDALAESARNRGLKLVRSRVRKPGKHGFGKAGLTDASGKPVFGIDGETLTATPDEVQAHLRSLDAGDWGASLDAPAPKLKSKAKVRRPSPPRQEPAIKPKPKPEPEPPPPSAEPAVRAAEPTDAAAIVKLTALLDHATDEAGVRRRIAQLAKDGLAPIVATLDKDVIGLCGIDMMVAIHRNRPVGRINILVVAEQARDQGIGRMLVAAAEEELRQRGCGLVEVTSNDRLAQAHAFYRHMGYERTSIRFCKAL
jgi:GNAT superfamily N-acetyltransferase